METRNYQDEYEQRKEYYRQRYLKNREKVLAQTKEWKKNNPDKALQHRKTYRQNNVEAIRQRRNEYNKRNPRKVKARQIKEAYGLTFERFQQMFMDQKGCCGICGKTFTNRRDVKVDHDHETTEVRELLCQNCNCGLGHFFENSELFERAINYLKKYKN